MNYTIEMMPSFPVYIVSSITSQINTMMSKVGIFYRVFGRVKSNQSICKKLNLKQYADRADHKRMQDIVGIRIAVYFDDDVELVASMLKKTFEFVDETVDHVAENEFGPVRMNMIFRIPKDIMPEDEFNTCVKGLPIDNTFELQVRTVLSEGWHEVEHDLRYKQQESWVGHEDYARALNSIIATLTNCDWTMRILFENLAHAYYMESNWLGMCRNHLRIRFSDSESDESSITSILNDNHDLAKFMLKVDRQKLLSLYFDYFSGFPCNLKNIIYICSSCVDTCTLHIPALLEEQINKNQSALMQIKR